MQKMGQPKLLAAIQRPRIHIPQHMAHIIIIINYIIIIIASHSPGKVIENLSNSRKNLFPSAILDGKLVCSPMRKTVFLLHISPERGLQKQ